MRDGLRLSEVSSRSAGLQSPGFLMTQLQTIQLVRHPDTWADKGSLTTARVILYNGR